MLKQKKSALPKIVISGGHLTPALALIDYILDKKIPVQIIFLGRLLSQDIDRQESQEKRELTERGITFVTYDAPKPTANLWLKILFGFQLILATLKAWLLLIKYRPTVFVSFGGYLAVPIGMAAASLRIPIITHEQTSTAGEANRFLSKFAKKVAISHPETSKLFPKDKVVLTGNPIRPDLIVNKAKRPAWASDINPTKPILLITGGNQGSYIINTTMAQILPSLITDWNIIHACGNPTAKINYLNELTKVKEQLATPHRQNYIIKEWLKTSELAWIYNNADGAISRSGANTVQEIAYAQIPAIFIPLPFAKGNEQYLNAKNLTDAGAALLLEQKDLSAETLLDAISYLKKHQKSIKRKLEPLKPQPFGAQKLWEVIAQFL